MMEKNAYGYQAPRGQLFFCYVVRMALLIWGIYELSAGQFVLLVQSLACVALTFTWEIFHSGRLGRRLARVPFSVQTAFNIFLLSSSVLGNAMGFYARFSFYDSIVHFFSGILAAWFAYGLTGVLEKKAGGAGPALAFVLALAAGAGSAACWEIYEFLVDHMIGSHLQLSFPGSDAGLLDTMTDILCGAAGTLVGAVGSARYCRKRGLARLWPDHPDL